MTVHDGFPCGTLASPGSFNRIGSERRFGVELEYMDVDDYEDLEGRTVFGAKPDGSVDGEFYSPILQGDNGLAACEQFCGLASGKGFSVSMGAGYHAHFDLRSENYNAIKATMLGYHHTTDFWLGACPRERATGSWARRHTYQKQDIESLRSQTALRNFVGSQSRYQWANFHAMTSHGTVELRIHETTLNPADVINWIIAHTRFIDALTTLGSDRVNKVFEGKSPSQIAREMRCILQNPTVMVHLHRRIRRFNPSLCSAREPRG